MTVCDLYRVLSPGVKIEIYSGGVRIANDQPFYLHYELLNLTVEKIKKIKKNKLIIEVY